MKITIAPRAKVGDDFMELWKDTVRTRLRTYMSELNRLPKYHTARWIERNGARVAALKRFLAPESRDALITKLRSLPFSAYSALEHNGVQYLWGVTNEILCDHVSGGTEMMQKDLKYIGRYNIGVYDIYIPVSACLNGVFVGLHFVPRAEVGWSNGWRGYYARHMHHIAAPTETSKVSLSPLDQEPVTCEGDYNQIITGALRDIDAPEIFRSCFSFLSRYNANHAMSSIETMPWAKKVNL